jgi:hypothetical protein
MTEISNSSFSPDYKYEDQKDHCLTNLAILNVRRTVVQIIAIMRLEGASLQ